MHDRFRQWLAPPQFDDEEKNRRAVLLHVILLVMLAFTLLNALSIALFVPEKFDISLNVGTVMMFAGMFVALRSGYVRNIAWTLCLVTSLLLNAFAFLGEGVFNPYFPAHNAVIMVSGLVLGGWRVFIFVALAVAGGLVNESPDYLSREFGDALLAHLWTFLATAFAILLADRYIRQAFARSTAQEKDLQDAMQQLYDEMRERTRAESDYRRLLDSAPLAISITDLEAMKLLYINQACAEMFGAKTPADMVGMNPRVSMTPEADAGAAERVRRLLDGQPIKKHILKFKRVNNEPFLVEISTIPVTYAGRKSALSMMADVTERHHAEQALRQREADYRRLLDTAPLGIRIVSLSDDRLIYVNAAAVEIFNAPSAEAMIGRSVRAFMTPEAAEDSDARRSQLLAGQPVKPHVMPLLRYDEQTFLAEVSSIPTWFEGQEAALSMVADVTERQRQEDSLRMFRTLVETATDAIVVMDLRGIITFANPSCYQIYDYAEGELTGSYAPDFWLPEDRERVKSVIEKGFQQPLTGETYQYRKDGTPFYISYTAFPLKDSAGNTRYIAAVIRDITEQREAEATLQEQKELLQTIFNHLPVMISLFDENGHYALVNQFWEQTMGWTMQEAIQHPNLLQEIYPDQARHQHVRDKIKLGTSRWQDEKSRTRDGRVIDTRWANVLLSDGRSIGIGQDITEYKRAEDDLREQKELLQTTFDTMPVMIALFEPDGRFRLGNSFWEQLSGWTSDEARSHPDLMREFYPDPEERQRALEFISAGEGVWQEFKTQMRDGRVLDMLWANMVLSDGTRIGIGQDISGHRRAERALEEERLLLRTLIDSLPDYITVKDREGRFILTNAIGAPWRDVESVEDVIGKTNFDYMEPELAEFYRQQEHEIMESGLEVLNQEEADARGIGGAIRRHLTSKVPFRNREGEIVGLVAITRDVTDLKRAEDDLREQKELLRTLIDTLPDYVFVKDREGRFIMVNDIGIKARGMQWLEEIVGKTDFDFISPERAEFYRQQEQEIMESGKPLLNVEESYSLQLAAEHHWFLTSKMPFRNSNGEIVGLVAISRDITDLKRVEAALRESEERNRKLLELSPVAIAVISMATNAFLYMNQTGAAMFGASSADDMLGRTTIEFWKPQFMPQALERKELLEAGQATPPAEYELFRLDGGTIQVEISSIPLTYEGQSAVLSVFNDISERRRIEQERLEAELLKVELDKERNLLHMKEQFISLMSHEFRTPLTIALSSKDILEKYLDRLSEDRRQSHFDKIEHAIMYITRMLDDILTLSKASGGLLEFHPQMVDLEQFMRDLLIQLGDGDHDILFESEGKWTPAPFDETLLRYMISHLVSNACKYSPPDTPVHVRLGREDEIAIIEVHDTGIGIPPDQIKSIYEPFFRGRNADIAQGTGLGMAIVKTGVEAHGGNIYVESELGKGTTFRVRLPLMTEFLNPSNSR